MNIATSALARRSLIKRLAAHAPVLLICPPSTFLLDERVFMSLGVLKVGAVLEQAGFAVEMLDLSGITNYLDATEAHVRGTAAGWAAITVTTPQLPAAALIAERIRAVRPGMRVICGGPHPTLVCAAVKLEKKAASVGRAHAALARLEELFDVIVAGDGESAVFEALAPDAPKVIDADDPKGPLFMTSAVYEETPMPARHLVDVNSYHYSIEGHPAVSVIAQLGCPFMCGFSLTGDSLIFTNRGFERLDGMIEGDAIVEKCEHGGRVHVHAISRTVATASGSAKADAIVNEGKRRVFEVRAENGACVRATAEHPFLIVENDAPIWRMVAELKVGDWLVCRTPEREWPKAYLPIGRADLPTIRNEAAKTAPTVMTEDVAWLVGYVIGDGCIPMDGRPAIHVAIKARSREKLVRIVPELFGKPLAIYDAVNTEKMWHGWIHSRAAYEFFVQSLGIQPGQKLRVPEIIRQSPRAVIQAFLDGLWMADGTCPNHHSDYLVTVSPDLAREVAALKTMLGEVPSVTRVEWEGKVHYRVAAYKNDRVPTKRALYKSLKSGQWYWRTPRNPAVFLGVRRRTLVESGLGHPLLRDGWHYVRVEAITPGLVEQIYDLRVPGQECFLVDGLVAHNCGGRNSSMLRRIRTRSTASVVAEIEHLHRAHGFTGFMCYDDELNVNKSLVELMNAIADLQGRLGVEFRLRGFVKSELFTDEQAAAMYRAGFRWILCGFEAGHPRILENIQKKSTRDENTRVVEICRSNGLKVKALMSVGHAGESEDTIMAVRDWLLEVKPDDFDCTVISAYPGTPYYDEAVPHTDQSNVWTYTCKKSGDRLHSVDVDYSTTADYYKGDPDGGYKAYVFTDYVSAHEIVRLRDVVEKDVRRTLNIPFNPGAPGVRYEHSMGQGANELPSHILRRSQAGKTP